MTYALLAVLFVAAAAVLAVTAALARILPRAWWRTTATVALVLVVLTAVFDSVMIALDLFRYDTAALLGLRVAHVPIEDFAWPVAAAVGLPALWEWLGRARGTDADSPAGADNATPDDGHEAGAPRPAGARAASREH
jgi:lycopene cyclase domain-containing protein